MNGSLVVTLMTCPTHDGEIDDRARDVTWSVFPMNVKSVWCQCMSQDSTYLAIVFMNWPNLLTFSE